MKRNPRNINSRQTVRIIIAILLMTVVILAGCQGQSILDTVFPRQDEALENPIATDFPAGAAAIEQMPSPTAPVFFDLTVWLPQQYDPEIKSEEAALLKNRLLEFTEANPKVNLSVRIKPVSGPGSILETLMSASAVAPDALPSIILISRSDLVQAVSKNLLYPVEGLSDVINENDWFDIAKELGTYQGTVYCLPFAVNALGLVYKNSEFRSDQPSWNEMISQSDELLFATGDPEALITLALYQSAGGILTDISGQPFLEADALAKVLAVYAAADKNRRISDSVLDYQTDDQVWETFISIKKGSALTWANHALADPKNMKLAMLPSLGKDPFTLAGGWMWCLTESHEQDRIHAIALAEFLVEADFLESWAPVSGFLPARPSSISAYDGIELQNTIAKILISAQVRPDKIQVSEIGAEIKIAISEVLQKLNTPEISALNAVKRLEAMEIQ